VYKGVPGRSAAPFLFVRRTGAAGGYLIALLGVLILNFCLLRALPGDVRTVIGAEVMTRVPAALSGNDAGISIISFFTYLLKIFRGDWGVSFFSISLSSGLSSSISRGASFLASCRF